MLGFPIVNDTMYGGGGPTQSSNERTDSSGSISSAIGRVSSIAEEAPLSTSSPGVRPSCRAVEEEARKSVEDAAAALCVCCTRGEAAAFSEEQLRREGIMLHALRYDFLDQSGPDGESTEGGDDLGGQAVPASLSLEVPPPPWV